MRTIVMDPIGNVYDASMVPQYTMLSVKSYVTKLPSGEVVHVLQLDPERAPQGVFNMAALERA